MTTRDEELDALEKELRTPYIETPDRMAAADGSMCWLDGDRRCGPDCMAFNTVGVGVEDDAVIQGHTQCVVLATMSSQNAGLISLIASNRAVVTELQDKRRIEQLSGAVPSPFGRKS